MGKDVFIEFLKNISLQQIIAFILIFMIITLCLLSWVGFITILAAG
jgi:hypothetical protein